MILQRTEVSRPKTKQKFLRNYYGFVTIMRRAIFHFFLIDNVFMYLVANSVGEVIIIPTFTGPLGIEHFHDLEVKHSYVNDFV